MPTTLAVLLAASSTALLPHRTALPHPHRTRPTQLCSDPGDGGDEVEAYIEDLIGEMVNDSKKTKEAEANLARRAVIEQRAKDEGDADLEDLIGQVVKDAKQAEEDVEINQESVDAMIDGAIGSLDDPYIDTPKATGLLDDLF